VPWATLAVTFVIVAVRATPSLGADLELERSALDRGEFWRLWTAHLVHFGAGHLLWNLAVFVPAGVWCERLARIRFRALLVIAPPAISLTVLAIDPALVRFAGLSGISTSGLTLLAIVQLGRPEADTVLWRGVLAVVFVKMIVESAWQTPLFVSFDDTAVRAVPLAHIVGAAMAVIVYFAAEALRRGRAYFR